MSKVSDITGLAALAGAGFIGWQIWKNKDAIGGFFGGIQSGFDDLNRSIGNLGSTFQSAGEQTVKVVVDTVNNTINNDAVKSAAKTITEYNATTAPNVGAALITDAIVNNDAVKSAAKTITEYNATTAPNVGASFISDFIDSIFNRSKNGESIDIEAEIATAQGTFKDQLNAAQAVKDSGIKSVALDTSIFGLSTLNQIFGKLPVKL